MTSRDFCYWLQGYLEISNVDGGNKAATFTASQVTVIQKHLNLVFKHEIDPSMGDAQHQQDLNNIHGPSGAEVYRC